MATVGTNDLKAGMKIEIDRAPFAIQGCEFVKPGKGQAFARVKIKNFFTGRVIEKTFKSNEKFDLADVEEKSMRLLYTEHKSAVFSERAYKKLSQPFLNFQPRNQKEEIWMAQSENSLRKIMRLASIVYVPPVKL